MISVADTSPAADSFVSIPVTLPAGTDNPEIPESPSLRSAEQAGLRPHNLS